MSDFALNLKMGLTNFRAGLQEIRRGLGGIAGAPIKKIASQFEPIAQKAKAVAAAVKEAQFALLGLAGAAGGVLAAISREAAADEATLQRLRATFGELSDDVQGFGSELAKSTHRTEGGVQGLLIGFDQVLKGMDLSDRQAADFSKTLSKLTIDMAAFNGVSEEEILSTFQTALVRGGPAVVKYGINLKDTRIEQEAFNRGFDPKNLTSQQEALVKLNIIMQDTQKAHGAAAATATTFRERMIGAKNAIAELFSDIGSGANARFGPLLDQLRETVEAVRAWIKENPQLAASISAVGATVLGALVALGTLAPVITNIVTILGAFFGLVKAGVVFMLSLTGAATALAAAFAAISLAGVIEGFRKFFAESEKAGLVIEGLRSTFTGIFDGLKDVASAIIEPIKAFVASVSGAVFAELEASAASLGASFQQSGEIVSDVLSRIADGIRSGLTEAFRFLEPIVVEAVRAIIGILEDLPTTLDAVGLAAQQMAAFLGDIFNIIVGENSKLGDSFNSLQQWGVDAFKGLEEALTSETIIQVLAVLRNMIAILALGFTAFYAAVQTAVGGAIELFAELTRAIGYAMKAIGLVSDSVDAAADEVLDFADRATDKAIELAEDARKKLVDVAARAAKEMVEASKDFDNPGARAQKIRDEQAERKKLIAQLQEQKQLAKDTAKQQAEALKEELAGKTKSNELTQAQRTELEGQARQARDIFLTDLSRAQTQDAITEASTKYAAQLDEVKKKSLDLVETNRTAVRTEEQKGEAARKTNLTLQEQEEITKRIKKAQEDVKQAVDSLLDARVKSTKTIEDDIALLRKQADLAADQAKSDKERGEIRLAYRLKEAQLIEENARKEREAAKQALDDLNDRKKAFSEFITTVKREAARREGKDLEVQVDEISDRFKEQIKNLTKVSDIKDFKAALANAITVPVEEARKRAQEAREELSRLIAERSKLQAGDKSGRADAAAIQNEINSQRDAVAQADRRVANLAQKARDVEKSLGSEVNALKDQLEASEAARIENEKKVAETQRLDKQGADLTDPTQIQKVQSEALEAATKAKDAAVSASEVAVQNATAVQSLATVGSNLAEVVRGGLQGLSDRVAEIRDVLSSLVDLQPIFTQAEVALVEVVDFQRKFGESLDDFGNLILTKFGETADGFTSHKRIIDAIAAKLAAVDIRRAAGDSSLEDLGLVSP